MQASKNVKDIFKGRCVHIKQVCYGITARCTCVLAQMLAIIGGESQADETTKHKLGGLTAFRCLLAQVQQCKYAFNLLIVVTAQACVALILTWRPKNSKKLSSWKKYSAFHASAMKYYTKEAFF